MHADGSLSQPRQEERGSVTRDRLVNAVVAVIGNKGYAGLRAHHVASAAGVSWGAAQHLFGDKNELLHQVVVRVSERFVQKLDAVGSATDVSLRDRVAKFVNIVWSVYSSPEYFAVVEIVRGTRDSASRNDSLAKALAQVSARIEQLWLRIPPENIGAARSIFACNAIVLALGGLAADRGCLPLTLPTDAVLAELIEWVTASLSGDAY